MPQLSEITPYFEELDRTGIYSNYGPMDRKLRAAISKRCGATDAILTSSGTTAITVALLDIIHSNNKASEAGKNKFCIMPSYTFVGTAHAVCNAGMTPFFADVDEVSLMLTPENALEAMSALDEPPAAIVVVSAFGCPMDFDAWRGFEKKHGIPIVFDAAAAFSTLKNIDMDYVCVSFHATKIPSLGEGGAVLCNSSSLAEQLILRTGFGFVGENRDAKLRGGNFRVSEYAACVGLASLDQLDENLEVLNRKAQQYKQLLVGAPCRFLENYGEEWVSSTLNVVLDDNSVVDCLKQLTENKVPYRHWWGFGCHTQSAFSAFGSVPLRTTNAVAPRVVGLPFHKYILDEHIEKVTECLK